MWYRREFSNLHTIWHCLFLNCYVLQLVAEKELSMRRKRRQEDVSKGDHGSSHSFRYLISHPRPRRSVLGLSWYSFLYYHRYIAEASQDGGRYSFRDRDKVRRQHMELGRGGAVESDVSKITPVSR